MKILSLHVYGYGKIVDKVIDTNMKFIQIYGENEAGKSTTMSFIHSILFGFPKRTDAEPRREPRMHNMYGGKLVVKFDDEKYPVEIERVKGKVQGDLKVYFKDGTVKGEQWLTKRLNHIDKKTYRSIFSFDVLGLQDIHTNMTEDRLQEYLLRAGALGSHEYDEMLTAIDKELATIYKKNGSVPTLNQEVDAIKEIAGRVKNIEANEARYTSLMNDRLSIEESLAHKRDSVNQLTLIHKQKMKEMMYHPEIIEWKNLEGKMTEAPVIFPEKGIERYIALKNKIAQTAQDIGLRNEKVKSIEADLAKIKIPKDDDIKALEGVLKKQPEFLQKSKELEQLKAESTALKKEIQSIRNDIGWKEDHLDVDDSNIVRDQVQSLLSQLDEVNLEEQYLMREIESVQAELKTIEQEIEMLTEEQVSDDRLNLKKELVDKEFELQEKERMYKVIRTEYDKETRERNKSRRILSYAIIAISAVLLLGGIFYMINDVMLLGIILTVLGVIGGAFYFVANRPTEDTVKVDYDSDVEELRTSIEEMKQANDLNFSLSDARDTKAWLKSQKQKKVNVTVKLDEMKRSLGEKEASKDRFNDDLHKIKEDLKINTNIENKFTVDAINSIRLIKEKYARIDEINTSIDEINAYKDEFKSSALPLLEAFGTDYNETNVFYEVDNLVTTMKEDRTKHVHLKDQLDLLVNEVDVLNEQNASSRIEIRDLFEVVDADDEEEFYYHARQYDEYSINKNRFEELTDKLNQEKFTHDVRTYLSSLIMSDLKSEEEEVSEQIDSFETQIQNEVAQLADINAEIKAMENDGALSELNHLYAIRKNDIQRLSEDYMSLMYIKVLIESHIKAVKDERLPVVVEEARNIFEYLTRGRYNNVSYDEKGGLRIRHSNGQIFQPSELSQSTKEMLYISLRFSLIKALKGYYNLPIIIDDAFVHFDKDRKKVIVEYLRSQVQDQALYFTCNLDSQIPSSQTIKLKEKV
ncbi:ATP-binding protein [Aliicoccus persicus]|uniref:Uncharacterized protein YhaN n=1 Tax=Aliicoccus persicus TaxID=930138 RepID=A0A662Z7L4_9STAP|nr:AAA family ATPase [Aliicoccus persicus]SEW19355.1 Uncharacterized protein YhaN [Aliicoccus persicus]